MSKRPYRADPLDTGDEDNELSSYVVKRSSQANQLIKNSRHQDALDIDVSPSVTLKTYGSSSIHQLLEKSKSRPQKTYKKIKIEEIPDHPPPVNDLMCQFCNMSFKTKATLWIHRRLHCTKIIKTAPPAKSEPELEIVEEVHYQNEDSTPSSPPETFQTEYHQSDSPEVYEEFETETYETIEAEEVEEIEPERAEAVEPEDIVSPDALFTIRQVTVQQRPNPSEMTKMKPKPKFCELKLTSAPKLNPKIEPITSKSPEQDLTCNICGKVCASKGYLLMHRRGHRDERFRNLEKLDELRSSEDVRRFDALGRLYSCTWCSERFDWAERLEKHIKQHHTAPNTECTACNVVFDSEDTLKSHRAVYHRKKELNAGAKHECPFCKKKFSSKENLIQHANTHRAICNFPSCERNSMMVENNSPKDEECNQLQYCWKHKSHYATLNLRRKKMIQNLGSHIKMYTLAKPEVNQEVEEIEQEENTGGEEEIVIEELYDDSEVVYELQDDKDEYDLIEFDPQE